MRNKTELQYSGYYSTPVPFNQIGSSTLRICLYGQTDSDLLIPRTERYLKELEHCEANESQWDDLWTQNPTSFPIPPTSRPALFFTTILEFKFVFILCLFIYKSMCFDGWLERLSLLSTRVFRYSRIHSFAVSLHLMYAHLLITSLPVYFLYRLASSTVRRLLSTLFTIDFIYWPVLITAHK